jgi:hypothetical protein
MGGQLPAAQARQPTLPARRRDVRVNRRLARRPLKLVRFATPGVKRLTVAYGGDGPLAGRTATLRLTVR